MFSTYSGQNLLRIYCEILDKLNPVMVFQLTVHHHEDDHLYTRMIFITSER